MKKFVCLGIPKPNGIMQQSSDSEHPTPLSAFPQGAGSKKPTYTAIFYFGNKNGIYSVVPGLTA